MSKYLDESGLAKVWNNCKNYVDEKTTSSNSATTKITKIYLASTEWSNNLQTVRVEGVSANEIDQVIVVMPSTANQQVYYDSGVRAISQAQNKLTFQANNIPTIDLEIYVGITDSTYVDSISPRPAEFE